MENHLISSNTSTLKELFQDQLYFIKNEFQSESKPLFQLIGENSKNIVFIVFSNDNSIPEADKELISKTLAGLKLSNNEIGFCISDISLATNFENICANLTNQKVVAFANTSVYTEEIMLKTIKHNDSLILPCPSLHELSADQALKVKWWNVLKAFVS